MRFGSLFSGIGGLDLGLERAGMECAWQVEIDGWCRRVLARHWPDVPRFGDVHDVGTHSLSPVNLICGGFPCQPVSHAGKRLAQADERWLWPEFARIVRVLRPRYVLIENVSGLLAPVPMRDDGGTVVGWTAPPIEEVFRDLWACGFDVEWDSIPAAAVGAPHLRYRVFIVAYANGQGLEVGRKSRTADLQRETPQREGAMALTASEGWRPARSIFPGTSNRAGPLGIAARSDWWTVEPDVGVRAHGISAGLDGGGLDGDATQGGPPSLLRDVWKATEAQAIQRTSRGSGSVPSSPLLRPEMHGSGLCQRHVLVLGLAEAGYPIPWDELRVVWGYDQSARSSHRRELAERLSREHPDLVQELSRLAPPPCPACWTDGSWEAGLSRVAPDVPSRVDRLRGLGNAVVPQVAEWIGRRLMEVDRQLIEEKE